MRILVLIIWFCCIPFILSGQTKVRNSGNLKVFEGGKLGLHSDLVNDVSFDQNNGLVGLYGEESVQITGATTPVFYDLEIANPKGIFLDLPLGVRNNVNFIDGDFIASRKHTQVYINFLASSFYVGESDFSKISGYAYANNTREFTFPVGDDHRLRMLTIDADEEAAQLKCAYFFEDPNFSKTLDASFSTGKKSTNHLKISDKEFWRLEGDRSMYVTLSWDTKSNVGALAEYITDLKVVGWNKQQGQWVDLGNTFSEGGLEYGTVRSRAFIPDNYEVLTIGGNAELLDKYKKIDLDNYYLTPNADGKNDRLRIEGVTESPNNHIQIFNRYGVMVYSKDNYKDEFEGYSNRDQVVRRNQGLDPGIYFYIITLHDLKVKKQGYMYINR
ncbi:gliding motility-associated C-terminal domain-containing protein [Zeaxanthinibacter enoshimensis]|uniref:Gliding motility-associated-like protein n=1 Tax=Zeaxanthinibacter enoshimensis TaxID=392009 RepID=A0A4R6TM47_9FLAO|nr:gliding motility-associated C-terminal domain-containing protein [Zeaxanthinibacter enoshimensis]TDQ30725.1 gliding motility-associated-like protein [Zeaxanthinibacter enoshimensis]